MQTYFDSNRRSPLAADPPQMTCMYVASDGYNSFTVGHASNSNTDQAFAYVVIG